MLVQPKSGYSGFEGRPARHPTHGEGRPAPCGRTRCRECVRETGAPQIPDSTTRPAACIHTVHTNHGASADDRAAHRGEVTTVIRTASSPACELWQERGVDIWEPAHVHCA